MKLTNFLCLLPVLIGGHCLAQSEFEYKRNISGVSKEGWHAVSLPSDIFRDLRSDFGDLRIYSVNDGDTVELPYVLDVRTDEVTRETVALRLFNMSFRKDTLFLTFEMNPSQKVNSVDLSFDQPNYFGWVTLEGSPDKGEWFEVVKDQRIVSVQNESGDYKLSGITFPVSEYRFLRARVKADARLTFKQATFQFNRVKPGAYHELPLTWRAQTDKKTKQTFVEITLHDYVPVSSLSVQADNDDFDYHRAFRLEYVRDSSRTEKGWIRHYQTLYEGNLTSFTANDFKFREVLAKEMRLVIEDRDNKPLRIRGASAQGPDVKVFSFLKPGDNFLYYGADQVSAPSYDLAYFENKIPDTVTTAILEPAVAVRGEKTGSAPLFQNKAWLWTIMALMIGGLGFYTIKMMRKEKP
ncbi:MAG TPA: DUF3999 family protein [Chryseosolibacter sp.]